MHAGPSGPALLNSTYHADMLRAATGTALAIVVAGLTGTDVRAQAAPAGSPGPGVGIRIERRAERFDYHFDNPSNFEPGPLVPHAIDQRYEADSVWLFLHAAYTFLNAPAFTEAGLTPRITTPGSDIDTFYQPSGDVITSGTRGDVRLRSVSIEQRFDLASWRAMTFGVALAYRRSSMDYLPSDRIITHTQPPSETREPVAGRETTWSHVLQSGFTASAPLRRDDLWSVSAGVEAYPITRARLNVSLPDKFPGELIRADTFGFGVSARLAIERRWNRASAGAGIRTGGVWSYSDSSKYGEGQVALDVYLRMNIR
jgi:hypothetical protein